jgi:hypothetical protein
MVLAYPLLGLAYLTDRMGAFVEPIFFTCFTVLVMVELWESTRAVPSDTPAAVAPAREVQLRVPLGS